MKSEWPSISVVMPALNEEANVTAATESVLRALRHLKIEGELIVVDDGSSDGTGHLVRGLMSRHKEIRMLRHERPLGMGAAFWGGVQVAQKEFVVMIPGDNENDPQEILKYLLLGHQVDMIIPFVSNTHVRSVWRRFLSFLYRSLINVTFQMNLNYTNGTVIYRRSVLAPIELKAKGFFYQTELLVRLIRAHHLYAEVPTRLRVRQHGQAKALRWNSILAVLGSFCRLVGQVYISTPSVVKEKTKSC